MKSEPAGNNNKPRSRPELLVAGIALIMVVWLLVLPRLAQQPDIQAFSNFLETRGVDPNAKFFTDQQAGFVASRHVMRNVNENSNAFWGFRQAKSGSR